MFLFAGYSDDTRALLDHLQAEAPGLLRRIVIVDRDPGLGKRLAPLGVAVVHGDPEDLATLMDAGVRDAELVVVFPRDPDTDAAHRMARALKRLCAAALFVHTPGSLSPGSSEWAIGAP